MILAVSSVFWAVFGLAMGAIALAGNANRGARRAGALMLGLMIAAGLVMFWTGERSERRAARAPEARTTEKKIARARAEFALARDEVRRATNELQVTLRTELPELKELGQKIRDAIKTGVRIEDQKLVIGRTDAVPVPPSPPEPPADADGDSDEDVPECESALEIAIEATGADNLARYFEDLAERPAAGRTEEMRQLRAALLELSAAERQALAERIAEDAENDAPLPRAVAKQAEKRRRPPAAPSVLRVPPVPPVPDLPHEAAAPRLKGGVVAALTVVALSAATAILKTATRRHRPRPR